MLEQFVWFSIQSEFGITLGELGKLAGEADPSLLGGPLIGIKSLVSTEASSSESKFMDGSTEQAAFGVSEIRTSQGVILSSYIISKTKGAVKQKNIEIIRDVAINLGRQLGQLPNLEEYTSSGRRISRETMSVALINACKIVRMNQKMTGDVTTLDQRFQDKLIEVFGDKKNLLSLIDEFFETKGWRLTLDFWEDGLLTREKRRQLRFRMTIHILSLLAEQDPLLMLRSSHKQNLIEKYERALEQILISLNPEPELELVKVVPNEIAESFSSTLAKINLRDLHNAIDIIFVQVIKRSFLSALKEEPSLAFIQIPRYPLYSAYLKNLPPTQLPHLGSFLLEIIRPSLNSRQFTYLRVFFSKFMEHMRGVKITTPTWALLISFCMNFVTEDEYKKGVDSISDTSIDGRWKKALLKNFSSKQTQTFKIDSFLETRIIAESVAQAFVEVVLSIIYDQLIGSDSEKIGVIPEKMITMYKELAPSVKATGVMTSILKFLNSDLFPVSFLAPQPRDFLIAALQTNFATLSYGGSSLDLDEKNRVKYQKDRIPLNEFLNKFENYEIIYDNDKRTRSDLTIMEPIFFLSITEKINVLLRAITLSAETKVVDNCGNIIKEWITQFTEELNRMDSNFGKKNIKNKDELINQDFSYFKHAIVSTNSLPPIIKKEYDGIIQTLETASSNLILVWSSIAAKIKLDQYSSDTRNSWKELKAELDKTLKHNLNKLEKTMKNHKAKISNYVKSIKKPLTKALNRDITEKILNYSSKSNDQNSLEKRTKNTLRTIATKYQFHSSFTKDNFKLSFALDLFENIPETFYESAYDSLISNKRADEVVREALSKASDKQDFEILIVDRSYEIRKSLEKGIVETLESIENIFIDSNAPIFAEPAGVFLQLGKIPVEELDNEDILLNSLNFPGILIERESMDWVIKYQLPYSVNKKQQEPKLVTLSDAIRYITLGEFFDDMASIEQALSYVAEKLESTSPSKLRRIISQVEGLIFSLEDLNITLT